MAVVTVKQHTRKTKRGVTVVKQFTRQSMIRSGNIVKKANSLVHDLSNITARGGFLSKPQKKAIYKARTLEAKHRNLIMKGNRERSGMIRQAHNRAKKGVY